MMRKLFGTSAAVLLFALALTPSGAAASDATTASNALRTSQDECQPIVDGSCIHCHMDGVCLSCIVYLDAGIGGVGHLGNHCLHG